MLRISHFVLIIMCLFLGVACGAGGSLPGTGTEAAPYLIEDVDDFFAFCNSANATTYWVSGVHVKLTCNLDLDSAITGIQFNQAPIAGDTDTDSYFDGVAYWGTFDGNGHVISNLEVNVANYSGLFGYLEEDALVKNLSVHGAISTSNNYAGFIAAFMDGAEIINCTSSGSVEVDHWYAGGIVGYAYEGRIQDCYYSGSHILSYQFSGGILGYINKTAVINCCSAGAVGASRYKAGGVAGHQTIGSVENCYNTGSVSCEKFVGGLIGQCDLGSISNSYNKGFVYASASSNKNEGGLVGYAYNASISSCFWDVLTSNQAATSGGGTGLTTSEMQDIYTFTGAGWDFNAEEDNGTEDIWHMPYDSVGYPMLFWQRDIPGDFTGQYGVNLEDFAVLAASWLTISGQANHNPNCNLDYSVTNPSLIDEADLAVFCQYWLQE